MLDGAALQISAYNYDNVRSGASAYNPHWS